MEYRRGDDTSKKEILVRLMGVQKKELPDGPMPLPKDDPKQPDKGKAPKGPQGPGAKFYEKKDGFANYYFNKQEKNRLLAAVKKTGDFSGAAGTWNIEGDARIKNSPAMNKFDLEMKNDDKGTVAMKLGAFPDVVEATGTDLGKLRQPAGSGGFLSAMYLWRHLLTMGEKGFPSDCTHGGGEPFYPPPADGSTPKSLAKLRVDTEILNTSLGVYKVKWFFARNDHKLLGFELRMQDLNEDPCEVYFSDYRPVDGRPLPHRMQVYYRDAHYGTFTVSSYKLAAK